MKSGLGKYRQQQKIAREAKETIALREELAALQEIVETDDGERSSVTYDQVVLSEEAATRLADEAIAEDEDLDVEKLLNNATGTKPKIVDKSSNKSTNDKKKSKKEKLGSREEIILEYAPLIKYVAQKIAARLPANIELDDLISSGVIGLMDAIEKYDPSRDNKFKTYAEFRIRGAILDELRAQDWVPRSVREKGKMLERAFAKIEQEKGRPATDEEVCEELKISQEEYYELLNQVRSVSLLSYDDLSSLSKGDKRAALGMSETGKTANPYMEVNSAHLKKMVSDAIKDLPEKQRLVLSLYYYEDLNLKEIGRVLDVTESRVSQLHTQAILRLKARLKNNFDDFLMMLA